MIRQRLQISGVVQGVGFRPAVARAALALGLDGTVRNGPDGVEIEVQGPPERIDALIEALRALPPPVRIDRLTAAPLPTAPASGFRILPSDEGPGARWSIPPDLATCPRCLAEHADPTDRRHGWDLISCPDCGPRWTILRGLPLDRERTAMADFPPCPACATELADPSDRRFHAQITACPACGPTLRLEPAVWGDPVLAAAARVRRGEVVAVQGLGGFQLWVDATDERAVARLRERKRRPDEPFAVLVAALPPVEEAERALLEDPAAPIVLVRADLPLAPSVGRGAARVGLLRPTTALHRRLAEAIGRPVVCTSANPRGEPLCASPAEARERLAGLADALLFHDRALPHPVDDGVARVVDGAPLWLRRARGTAPSAFPLPDGPVVLAAGAHLERTVALAVGRRVLLSPYLGRGDGRRTDERVEREARALLDLLGVRPEVIACDAHPDLASTRMAERWAEAFGAPLVRCWHHEAHLAAVLAEHPDVQRATGLAWDGVGLGPDGTAWGGEALRWDGGRFTRVGHLRPFPLPGGDLAARSPRRCAAGLLHAAGRRLPGADDLHRALDAGVNAPLTSSIGRLFDAVAFLCGGPAETTFQAQAATWLEDRAEEGRERADAPYPLPLRDGVLDWGPLLDALLADDAPTAVRAARFHLALIDGAVAQAGDDGPVLVAGGCFQNGVLLSGLRTRLGPRLRTASRVPPNDEAIALGQARLARHSPSTS